MANMEVLRQQSSQAFSKVEPTITEVTKLPPVAMKRRRVLGAHFFQYEVVRLATFEGWPCDFVSKEALAKSGFVYNHVSDEVKCYYCKVVLLCFEKGDEADEEHRKANAYCPLYLGTAVNIPKDGDEYKKMNEYVLQQLDSADPPQRRNAYEFDAVATVDTSKRSQFRDYANINLRISSFRKAPRVLPDGYDMAEVGLFYSTYSDLTTCYECGGGIMNWSPSEDPEEVHDTLYPHCSLAQERLEDYPELRMEHSGLSSHKHKTDITVEDFKHDFLKFPWLQDSRKRYKDRKGDEVIVEALAEDFEKYGSLPFTIEQVREVLAEYFACREFA